MSKNLDSNIKRKNDIVYRVSLNSKNLISSLLWDILLANTKFNYFNGSQIGIYFLACVFPFFRFFFQLKLKIRTILPVEEHTLTFMKYRILFYKSLLQTRELIPSLCSIIDDICFCKYNHGNDIEH